MKEYGYITRFLYQALPISVIYSKETIKQRMADGRYS